MRPRRFARPGNRPSLGAAVIAVLVSQGLSTFVFVVVAPGSPLWPFIGASQPRADPRRFSVRVSSVQRRGGTLQIRLSWSDDVTPLHEHMARSQGS